MTVLLLDMDGPLADFDKHFYEKCIELGYTFDVEGLHEQRHRFFTEHMVDKAERAAAREMVDSAGWFEQLPVTPGAQQGVQELLDAGVEVWVCTKPLEVNPTCRDAKAAWLREHFPELEKRLIIAPDKSLVAGDVLLDDAPHIGWIDVASWRPIVFTAPYNGEGSEWEHLIHWTWADGTDRLLSMLRHPSMRQVKYDDRFEATILGYTNIVGTPDGQVHVARTGTHAERHEAFREAFREELSIQQARIEAEEADTTNPKDLLGIKKPQLHLVPESFIIRVAQAMTDGAAKYGPFNWRLKAVRASVYQSAARRHLAQWFDGEECASDSGYHHLAHAAACLGILIDAIETGNLVDDRPPPGAAARLIAELTEK